MKPIDIRIVDVVEYITPLREGGSLPAIVLGDDEFEYVIKFRGAGQGVKALIAEFIGGELARAMGLKVPEIVFMTLNDSFHKSEGDEEIQDLLKFSVGLNLGLHFLSRAITFDPLVTEVDQLLASKVVLLDAIITNIDRTAKNANMLMWHDELWLIDHGASLYFHHNWDTWRTHLSRPFALIKEHILIERATRLQEAADEIAHMIRPQVVDEIIRHIPDQWMEDSATDMSNAHMREAYSTFLISRVDAIDSIVKEIESAR